MADQRVQAVGAIITDSRGRLLLIRRGHDPQAGYWSLPGGRIEPGETGQQALVREVREETGLRVIPGRLIGTVERPWPGGRTVVIRDYAAVVTGGDLAAGDDADDARWFGPGDVDDLPLTTGLVETLTAWDVLAPRPSRALVAEATRRAGVVWLTVPGQGRAVPAWHVWRAVDGSRPAVTDPPPADPLPPGAGPPPPGAAYLVTGPGEQMVPGLGGARRVTVTVASKESGGRLITWVADVHRVDPGSAEWDAVIGPLAAGRLNAVLGPGESSPERRWARSGTVFRLTPRWP